MIGLILGSRYELLEKIGEGGMAEVYKARCNKLNRFVAVKILKNEFCNNDDIVNKFKREATAIATLSDNNIVNVLDVGTQENINYIVMEYVKGKTLKEFIKQFGKLNYESAITIGIQIAKALDCAHKNNIIHRDVKPQNILVTEEGVIKVTDFGIAKSASSATLTNTTTIMGSAHYFSPEQAKGSVVDNRADIYSLGVVLYEMVTGKLPFEADSPVTIALKHIQEDVVSPKNINSKVPENLSKLIVKCMEKDPAMRYQSAKEIITDLQKIKDDPNVVLAKDTPAHDEGHTIVMAPVKVSEKDAKKKQAVKDLEDEYYDDDEEYDDDDYDDDEDDYDRKKSKGSNKKLIIGIISVVVLLLLGVGAYALMSGGSTDTGEVTIPSIKGLKAEEAKKVLTDLGLVYQEADVQPTSGEAGIVYEVSPKEGSVVKKGSEVRVIITTKEPTMKMPDLSGADQASSETILRSLGLTKFNFKPEFDEKIEAGKVIKTVPEAKAEVSKDTEITIYLSKGPEKKYEPVADVKGLKVEEAKAKLSKFEVNVVYKEVTEKDKDGIVLDQTNVGKNLEVESTVTITVGKYKEPEKEKVDLSSIQKGMTLAQIKGVLGNKVEYIIKGPQDGILDSFSHPNQVVDVDTKVTFTFVPKPTTPSGGGNENNQNG